jgi:hypothetical protein
MSTGKIAFELRKQEVDVAKLLPTKIIKEHTNIRRFQTIVDSLPELGLIEPLMVYPQKSGESWLVLDGHLRLLALKQLGWKTVEIIVASEDDRFTYNARVNRLPPIQAHKMIVKAVKNGVKPERIAKALFMPIAHGFHPPQPAGRRQSRGDGHFEGQAYHGRGDPPAAEGVRAAAN